MIGCRLSGWAGQRGAGGRGRRILSTTASNDTALDECFWRIADRIVDLPSPPVTIAGEVVGSESDNRSTHPNTDPTTPALPTLTGRLRQLAGAYREGLVSDSEYAQQRARILGEL